MRNFKERQLERENEMKIIACCGVVVLALGAWAECFSVKSPDGQNEIRLETEPTLSYSVWRGGKALTAPSPMAMEIVGKPILGGAGLKATGTAAADRNGTVATPIYKKASVDETAKGLKVSFGDWAVELVARNDGVAYR